MLGECHCWWTKESSKVHVAKFYGRLHLVRSVLRASKLSVLKLTEIVIADGPVNRWAYKPVNHTSWVAVVTPTDRPKSARNLCLIELFCGAVCVVALPF